MLKPLLKTWYSCARQMGDVDLSIKLLIEMMGQDMSDVEEPNALEEDLLAILQSTVPAGDEPLAFDLPGAKPLCKPFHHVLCTDPHGATVIPSLVFWKEQVQVEEPAAFQLHLQAPSHSVMSSLPFSSLEIYFSQKATPLIVSHTSSETELPLVSRVDLGAIEAEAEELSSVLANLRWQPGGTMVITGALTSKTPGKFSVSPNWR